MTALDKKVTAGFQAIEAAIQGLANLAVTTAVDIPVQLTAAVCSLPFRLTAAFFFATPMHTMNQLMKSKSSLMSAIENAFPRREPLGSKNNQPQNDPTPPTPPTPISGKK